MLATDGFGVGSELETESRTRAGAGRRGGVFGLKGFAEEGAEGGDAGGDYDDVLFDAGGESIKNW